MPINIFSLNFLPRNIRIKIHRITIFASVWNFDSHMEVQTCALEDMWAHVVGSNRAMGHNEELHDWAPLYDMHGKEDKCIQGFSGETWRKERHSETCM